MADDEKPELFSEALQKNAKHGASYEIGGGLIGGAIGALVASGRQLKGFNFFAKTMDFAFMGWLGGMIGRLWSERSSNANDALRLDSKMIQLEHENKVLKHAVVESGGHIIEHHENHAEKIVAKRAEECSSCKLKH